MNLCDAWWPTLYEYIVYTQIKRKLSLQGFENPPWGIYDRKGWISLYVRFVSFRFPYVPLLIIRTYETKIFWWRRKKENRPTFSLIRLFIGWSIIEGEELWGDFFSSLLLRFFGQSFSRWRLRIIYLEKEKDKRSGTNLSNNLRMSREKKKRNFDRILIIHPTWWFFFVSSEEKHFLVCISSRNPKYDKMSLKAILIFDLEKKGS